MTPALPRSVLVLSTLLVGMLGACQDPDVGQSCSIDVPEGPVAADYLETGKTECENLVCIRSPQRATPYCSKPCVANDDCSTGETGLVCRTVVLDPEFLAQLPEEVRRRYLGDVQFSSFCAAPLP
jgi:hypothetical protein